MFYFFPFLPINTGCPKKNKTGFLLNISATNDRIFKSFFSPENWDPYAHFEYKTIFVRLKGAEKCAKQNAVLKQINSYLYCHILALKPQNFRQAPQTGPRWALIAPKLLLLGLVTQTDWIDVITITFLIIFKICGSSRLNNLSFYQNHRIKNPILFREFLGPLWSYKNGSVFKMTVWISVFRRKKRFENPIIGCRDIRQ